MIVQSIQLALTPVFVLVAIANFLNILSTRLGRIVDRARLLQDLHNRTSAEEHDAVVVEIRAVDRRIELATRAIRVMVISALTIGVTVAVLFVQGLTGYDLQHLAGATFIAAIVLLLHSLVLFLKETRVAAASLRIPRDLLELHRQL